MQGSLIVASPRLDKGIFARTVALVTEHNRRGTTGVVLNRTSTTTVEDLMHKIGMHGHPPYNDLVHMGGPINETAIQMLHTNDWYSASTNVINDTFSISHDNFMLEKMAMNNTPQEWIMLAGSAGWAPGQLESELDEDLWLTIDANPAIVFSSKKDELWNIAIEIYSHQMVESFF
jgi:putative transcriptional regulator